jgi:cytochrome c peroxidase
MADVFLRRLGGVLRLRRPGVGRAWAFVFLALLMTVPFAPHETPPAAPSGKTAAVLAPGWEPLNYPAPVPGTYELPVLGEAADGPVLDTSARPRRLHEYLGDKVVVLSFVYMSCPDANACPLATYVLSGTQRRLLEHPSLRDQVRLVTLSFDPEHDRPEIMARRAGQMVRDGFDWSFLTTESERSLAPILRAYGQTVRKEYDRDGMPLGTMSHVLRVFLIDRERKIRNIYSTSYLHADTLWSDIQTVLPNNGSAVENHERGATAEGESGDPAPGSGGNGCEHAG